MGTSVNLNVWFLVYLGSVFDSLFFVLYTTEMWNDLENKILSYTDDVTLYTEVASPYDHINVPNSLNGDLLKIQFGVKRSS